ncbi:MAG: ComEC/Rec2 family competence protein [Candidatus Pacebacteria bacterium]|nr:ComEC/Rec2 family competence protein [Candidatus Paceibacterota bacterium]
MKLNKNIKLYSLLFLIIINVIIFYAISRAGGEGLLKVTFLDVGQGDAIFIESPDGNQILIDSGANKNISNVLSRVMPFYDRSIDAVVATHPDQDHIGGFPEILKRYKVGRYFDNGLLGETSTFKEISKELVIEKVSGERLIKDEIIDLGDGVFLKVFYPNIKLEGSDTNKNSVVMKLIYGDSNILLTGDIPTDVEKYLTMTSGEELDSDILKVAHHGSKNSLSEEFFSVVSPEYSIISASKDNSFGHPHKEIIDALNSIGTNILRTYEIGDITFVSDGDKFVLEK